MNLLRALKAYAKLPLKNKLFYLGYISFGTFTLIALTINILGEGDVILILVPALLYAAWPFIFPLLANLINTFTKKLAISLTIASFIVAITSPVILSFLELNIINISGGSISSSLSHEYEYSKQNISLLETAIARSNGQINYKAPSKDLFVKLDIERVKDIDLSNKTIYLAGKVVGTWTEDSIVKKPITGSTYALSRIRDYSSKDLMEDILFPDIVIDDYYMYDNLLFNTLESDSGKKVFVSEYRFAGNFNIVPNFRSYPFDSQALAIQLAHKILFVGEVGMILYLKLLAEEKQKLLAYQ